MSCSIRRRCSNVKLAQPWRFQLRRASTSAMNPTTSPWLRTACSPTLNGRVEQVRNTVQFVPFDAQVRRVDVRRHFLLAGLERPTDLLEDFPFVGVPRMEFKTKIAEPALAQPTVHDIQGGHLLRHEEHGLAVVRRSRDDVRDGL